MSMLSSQSKELRDMADMIGLEGVTGDDLPDIQRALREAADAIESMRDRLQAVGEQSCHATQANYEHCKYSTNRGWRDTSRYSELFGTPEKAARTLEAMDVDVSNWCQDDTGNQHACKACPFEYNCCGCYLPDGFSLLEWLKSEA